MRLMPTAPRLFDATVVRSAQVSPSFQRVTITGPRLAEFEYAGFDHWFRLFIPNAVGAAMRLPTVRGRSWWAPYLAIPAKERPHYSNYTVADFRVADGVAEMDIDVVLHADDTGATAGGIAIWATTTTPGTPLAFLDQGRLFDPPADVTAIHVIADESGLPAARGILRSLPADATGTVIIEVPEQGDIVELVAPSGIRVRWIARDGSGDVPGTAALAEVQKLVPDATDYAFIVGESALATGGRRALHKAGLPKPRITFSGFWKH